MRRFAFRPRGNSWRESWPRDRQTASGAGDAVQFCWRKRWGSNPQAIEGALFSRQAPSPSVGWLFRGGEGGSRSRIRSFERPA